MSSTVVSVVTYQPSDISTWGIEVPTGLPPLQTVFTPPESCTTRWMADRSYSSKPTLISGYGVYEGNDVESRYWSACYPYLTSPRYSPGICTSGQALARIWEYHISSTVIWAGLCCKSGMQDVDSLCQEIFSRERTALAWFTTSMLDQWGTMTTISLYDSLSQALMKDEYDRRINSPTVVSTGTAHALPIQVYWKSTDLSLFPRQQALSLAAIMKVPFGDSSSSTPSSTSSMSPPDITEPSMPHTSLNLGTKVGVGIGTGLFTIFGIIFLLHLWRRRRQRHRQGKEAPPQADIPEMGAHSRGLAHFIGGEWRAETDGSSEPVEAGSRNVWITLAPLAPLVELDGDQGGKSSVNFGDEAPMNKSREPSGQIADPTA